MFFASFISIVRKEEKADGSGVELVPDVVTMSTNETEPMVENGYNLSGKQLLSVRIAAGAGLLTMQC